MGGRLGVGQVWGGMLFFLFDMVLFLVGLNNFLICVYENLLDLVNWLVVEMICYDVKLEIEVFDFSYILQVVVMYKDGCIKDWFYVQFVMGVKNVMFVDREVFDYYIYIVKRLFGDDMFWCVVGIGLNQLFLNEWVIGVGGYVCMGLEDNVWFDRDMFVFLNVVLVKCIVDICVCYDRLVVSWQQV